MAEDTGDVGNCPHARIPILIQFLINLKHSSWGKYLENNRGTRRKQKSRHVVHVINIVSSCGVVASRLSYRNPKANKIGEYYLKSSEIYHNT